jgi:hypothetical protein
MRKLTRESRARLRRGNPRWLLASIAEDMRFRFLGEHSRTADFHSKEQRLARLHKPRGEVGSSDPPPFTPPAGNQCFR